MGRKEYKRFDQNEQVRELLRKESHSEEEILFIKQAYTGIGGLTKRGWENGQFFTPSNVAKFVVDMLGIEGGRVLEPSCGGGSFLEHLPDSCEVVGIEVMQEAAQVAKVCYPHATIHQGDALTFEFAEKFDFVIGNPPFSLNLEFDFACGKKFKSEAAFIEYGLRQLKVGGILGFIVPDSILSTSRDGVFRQWVMQHYRYLGTISLPPETFYHVGTTTKTSLIMIENDGLTPEERGDYQIMMAISECVGWDGRGREKESDLDRILRAYREQEWNHMNRRSQGAMVLRFKEPEYEEMSTGQLALVI